MKSLLSVALFFIALFCSIIASAYTTSNYYIGVEHNSVWESTSDITYLGTGYDPDADETKVYGTDDLDCLDSDDVWAEIYTNDPDYYSLKGCYYRDWYPADFVCSPLASIQLHDNEAGGYHYYWMVTSGVFNNRDISIIAAMRYQYNSGGTIYQRNYHCSTIF